MIETREQVIDELLEARRRLSEVSSWFLRNKKMKAYAICSTAELSIEELIFQGPAKADDGGVK